MDPFEVIKIPAGLIPPVLIGKSPEDLAFYLKFGWSIYQKVSKIHEENAKMDAIVPASQVAAVIGQSGEEYVSNIYKTIYKVDNVTRRGHTGDLIVSRNGDRNTGRILVEVKKYTTIVAPKEVEKFYRDLNATQSVVGGIFISLNTKIQNIDNPFHFELWNGLPLIFLVSKDPEIIKIAASLIWAHVDSRGALDEEFYQKIRKKLSRMSEHMDQLSLSRTYVNETRIIMERQLSKIYEGILVTEMQLKQDLTSMNKSVREYIIGGEDAIITENFTWDIPTLEKQVINKFDDSLYAKDVVHRKSVNTIITQWANVLKCEAQVYKTEFNSKGLNILEGTSENRESPDDNYEWTIALKIFFIKSRTDIAGDPACGEFDIPVPEFAKYSDGLVMFQVDKKSQKDGIYDKIIEYLKRRAQ